MADFKLKEGSLSTVIDDNAALTNNSRAAGDYDNATNLHPFCHAYLTVQYDTTAPTAGDAVAELYVLPGDGEASQAYPDGGDAGLGTNDDPQAIFLVGAFESINPSTSVDEVLCIPFIPLSFAGNRFVLKNTSGQTFDLTWQLDIKTFLFQSP